MWWMRVKMLFCICGELSHTRLIPTILLSINGGKLLKICMVIVQFYVDHIRSEGIDYWSKNESIRSQFMLCFVSLWFPVNLSISYTCHFTNPNSKVHGTYMGPTWGRQDPGGTQVGPMNLAIREGSPIYANFFMIFRCKYSFLPKGLFSVNNANWKYGVVSAQLRLPKRPLPSVHLIWTKCDGCGWRCYSVFVASCHTHDWSRLYFCQLMGETIKNVHGDSSILYGPHTSRGNRLLIKEWINMFAIHALFCFVVVSRQFIYVIHMSFYQPR